jgi:hypothetical protein
MLENPLAAIPMSQNPCWTIFHVAEIWLAERYGALKPNWFNFPMLKTLLGENPLSKYPVGAIFHVLEIWLAVALRASQSDWLNSPMLKTLLGENPMLKYPMGAIFHVLEIYDVLLTPLQTSIHPHKLFFFHMTLPTVEGKRYSLRAHVPINRCLLHKINTINLSSQSSRF